MSQLGTKELADRSDAALNSQRGAAKSEAVSRLIDQVCPPSDPREHDLLYRQLLDDLRRQYATGCPVVEVLLSGLAQDCLQVTRCRQAIERLQHIPGIEPRELAAYERSREAHADTFAIRQLLTQSQLGLPFACPPEIACRFAVIVEDLLQQDILDFEEAALTPEAVDDLSPSMRDEYDHRLAIWRQVEPARDALATRPHVVALLAGSVVPSDAERQALDAMMSGLDTVLLMRRHSDFAAVAVKKTERYQDVPLCDDSENVRKLALLDSYLRQIERAIERRLKHLKTYKPRSR